MSKQGEFWVARDADFRVYPFWNDMPPTREDGEDGMYWWAYPDMAPPADEEELPYEKTAHLPFDAHGTPIKVRLEVVK